MNLFFVLHFFLGMLLGVSRWSQMQARDFPDNAPAALKTTAIATISTYVAIVFCLLTLIGDFLNFGAFYLGISALLIGLGAILQIYLIPRKFKFVLTFIAIPLCIASLGVISRLWLLIEVTVS